jgi:hypothetical protein
MVFLLLGWTLTFLDNLERRLTQFVVWGDINNKTVL